MLALIIGAIVTVTLAILGVPNALFLGLLAGILYLQQRTGTIASCISDAFRAPPPAPSAARSR